MLQIVNKAREVSDSAKIQSPLHNIQMNIWKLSRSINSHSLFASWDRDQVWIELVSWQASSFAAFYISFMLWVIFNPFYKEKISGFKIVCLLTFQLPGDLWRLTVITLTNLITVPSNPSKKHIWMKWTDFNQTDLEKIKTLLLRLYTFPSQQRKSAWKSRACLGTN